MPNQQRKLAAIMFTDMVGYSALSQKNEELALALLEEHRSLLRPIFPQFNGIEIKTIGDAFLVEFASAVEAANCAIDIQKMLVEHNASATPERRILLRIGLHIGDVVTDGDDVLGDGVNIASRIEPLAEPGGICVTEDVAHQIRNKTPGVLRRIGERKLKNIEEPVIVYKLVLPWEEGVQDSDQATRFTSLGAMAAELGRVKDKRAIIAVGMAVVALAIWGRWGGGGAGALDSYEYTVAVMPFENLTNDPDFDVWERGLANLVISDLSGSKELYVLDSQSLFDVIQAVQQSRKAQLIPDLAREVANRTQVKQVILGDILRAGTYIRVQARLLTVKTGKVDFSYKVDVETEDGLIGAAEEISRAMMNHLEINVLRDRASPEGREGGYTESAAAFKYYIEGLDQFYRRQYRQAIPLLEKAAAIDSNFSYALGYLTFAFGNTDQVSQMKVAAARNRRLSGRLSPIQQLVTDFIEALVNKNVNDQIRLLHQIVKAEPLARSFWFQLGFTYNQISQSEQAIRSYDKAYTLSKQWDSYWQWVPLYDNYGNVLHATGSHRKELAVYEYGLKAVPEAPIILNRLGIHYLSTGDTQGAADVLDRYREALVRSGSSETQILRRLGLMHSSADSLEQAQAYFEQSIDSDPENALAHNSLAWLLIDSALDTKAGLVLAEKALELRPGDYSFLYTYGWGLFKLGRYVEAVDALQQSWALRPFYSQSALDHLETARKALEEQE